MPVTRWLFTVLQYQKNILTEYLAANAGVDSGKDREMVGRITAIDQVLNIRVEESLE